VWRHQRKEAKLQEQRNRKNFTCRNCDEEHRVPADEIYEHQQQVQEASEASEAQEAQETQEAQEARTQLAGTPYLDLGDGAMVDNATVNGKRTQIVLETQDVPECLVMDMEYTHMLQDLGITYGLPDITDVSSSSAVDTSSSLAGDSTYLCPSTSTY
jgi:hypothetical protein